MRGLHTTHYTIPTLSLHTTLLLQYAVITHYTLLAFLSHRRYTLHSCYTTLLLHYIGLTGVTRVKLYGFYTALLLHYTGLTGVVVVTLH
jgi:hypothetical protein